MTRETIDWAWLKGTLPGMEGAIPGLGLLYKHLPATRMKAEQILVLDEPDCQRIIKVGNHWTRPDQVGMSVFKFGEKISRHVAS